MDISFYSTFVSLAPSPARPLDETATLVSMSDLQASNRPDEPKLGERGVLTHLISLLSISPILENDRSDSFGFPFGIVGERDFFAETDGGDEEFL